MPTIMIAVIWAELETESEKFRGNDLFFLLQLAGFYDNGGIKKHIWACFCELKHFTQICLIPWIMGLILPVAILFTFSL